jgi:hypothetical protein
MFFHDKSLDTAQFKDLYVKSLVHVTYGERFVRAPRLELTQFVSEVHECFWARGSVDG